MFSRMLVFCFEGVDTLNVCVVHEVAIVGVKAAGLFYEAVVILHEPRVKVPSCF